MRERYVELVHAYLRDGREADLAAIGDMRDSLIENAAPIEELVGMHEQAMLTLKDTISSANFADVVTKTSTCLMELAIAYSLADQKKQILLDREQRVDRERQRLESLGQMAGGIAHEFNNLLQPIIGMTELALEDAEPESELAEQLGVILKCANEAASYRRAGVLTAARQAGATRRDRRACRPCCGTDRTIHLGDSCRTASDSNSSLLAATTSSSVTTANSSQVHY